MKLEPRAVLPLESLIVIWALPNASLHHPGEIWLDFYLIVNSLLISSLFYYYRCDCKFDCQFGEDEEACDDEACSKTLFRCPNELRFINITWVCDGLPDCTSGADELPALCPELTTTTQRPYCSQCSPEEFECSSGQCIPSIYRCDEFRHCNDGTDEGPTCGKYFQIFFKPHCWLIIPFCTNERRAIVQQ